MSGAEPSMDAPTLDDGVEEALALVNAPVPAPGQGSEPGSGPARGSGRASGPGPAQGAARVQGAGGVPVPGAGSGTRHRASAWGRARDTAVAAGRRAHRRTHRVPLAQALGQVLAAPLAALTDLPSFDTSAMDGWAVAGPGPWHIRDAGAQDGSGVLAGQGAPVPLADGEAVRIATGARIPGEATAVIRSEHARTDDAKALLYAERDVVTGQDIRPRGQECRSGDRLLPEAALVTPAVLGLAAAAGYDELATVARPRVEVFVLGDELLAEGLPHEGLIRDALGPMLGPWLRMLGADVVATRRLGDDAEVLFTAVSESGADVVVTTGGTAAGPVDHVHPVLGRLGAELLVDGVAVRPGHPMLLARISSGKHLVGLPGNPLAAVSALLTLAEPLLRELAGRAGGALSGAGSPAPHPTPYTAPLSEGVHGHPYDTRLVPVVHRGDHVVPLRYNGPAMLRGIAAADGLAVVPPGGTEAGGEVEVLDLPWMQLGAGEGCFT
ncbi:molybdopterin-binding protein [Streptomyces sp. cg36]|uniref:molybdopterin molybdotransferase MoeA n=1 Tax=Streptomyces sp. cg36 TaxID=3238798 RepID=UPI0034E1FAB6